MGTLAKVLWEEDSAHILVFCVLKLIYIFHSIIIGTTTPTARGLRVPFMTSQDLHIGSTLWDTLMTNYSSYVTHIPFTLSGPGIVGVLHGSQHRYISTRQVYCTCGCHCGEFNINMYDDFDVSHYQASPFDPFDVHYDAQRVRVRHYRLEESTGAILPGLYNHARILDHASQRQGFAPLVNSREGSNTRFHVASGMGTFPLNVERHAARYNY